jgi:nitroreductase
MDLTTIDHLLTTTRSVRKRLDLMRPVEPEVIEHCIEIALQAPTGSNLQGWHFLVVADAAKRAALADLYRQAHIAYYNMQQAQPPQYRQDDLRARQRARVGASSLYLREYLHAVPLYIIPCIKERMAEVPHLAALAQYETLYHATIYGSIFPAVWSLMLALRARGLGSSLTTLHLMYAREAAALLDLPHDVRQVALLPVAYFTGTDFKPAQRLPAREITSWNGWGQRR